MTQEPPRQGADERLAFYPCGLYRFRMDKPRFVDYVSEGFCAMTGYSREALARLLYDEGMPLVYPPDRPRVREQLDGFSGDGAMVTLEYRYVHGDGGIRHAMDTLRAARDADGVLWGYAQFMDVSHLRERERQLRQRERIMRSVAGHSDRVVYTFDLGAERLQALDPARSRDAGLPESCWGLAHCRSLGGRLMPESMGEALAFFSAIRRGAPKGEARLRVADQGAEPRWFDARFTAVPGEAEGPGAAVLSFLDITEAHERELAYLRFQRSVEREQRDGLLHYEANLTTDRIERQGGRLRADAADLSGMTYTQAADTLRGRYLHGEAAGVALRRYSRDHLLALHAEGVAELSDDFRTCFADGTAHWVRCKKHMITDPFSGHVKLLTFISDVTEEKDRHIETQRLAERDGMTDLYNRTAAQAQMRHALGTGARCALILLDLDDLKGINDSLGHPEGDRALVAIADAMRAHFRPTDILCRAGGDEFMALLTNISNRATLRGTMRAFMRRVSELRVGPGEGTPIHCSIGGAFSSPEEADFDALYRHADRALYHVKRSGKNGFSFYTPDMETRDYAHVPRAGVSLLNTEWYEAAELDKLLYAIASHFPLVISANLTQNSYYMMEYDTFASHQCPEAGNFDELIEGGAETFLPEDRESFLLAFSRERLLAARAGGARCVSHEGRQRGDDGVYRWVHTDVIFAEDEGGDACQITLARPVEAERVEELERLGLRGRMLTAPADG